MTAESRIPSDWYQTFFTAPVMRFWEAAVPQAATDAEVAFILRHIAAAPPASILDVPCGSGRHALALASMGFAVTGIDLSEASLGRAEALARSARLGAGAEVRFARANMLELEVARPTDALLCLGNSLGYFEPALTHQLFCKFAAALRVGGRLIVDTSICAESVLPLATERVFSFPGGTYQQEITYDASQSIINTRAQLTIDGCKHELRYRHFVMTSGELVRSVTHAGFDLCRLCGDTEDGAFGPGSPRLLLVAARR